MQPILLEIPDELYERVRLIADDTSRPMESILLDSLNLLFGELPPTEALTLPILETFSDEQLWAIVYRPLTWHHDTRLRELTALSKISPLNPDELHEMEQLVATVDRYVLLRSQVLLLLKERGFDVERRLKLGA